MTTRPPSRKPSTRKATPRNAPAKPARPATPVPAPARPAAAPAKPPANARPPVPPFDPAELAASLAAAAERSARVIGDFAARQAAAPHVFEDELGLGKAFLELSSQMLANPAKLAEAQLGLWNDYMNLWQSSFLRMVGAEAAPVVEPDKGDKRFRHEDWQQLFLFDYIKQSYLIAARWLHHNVASVEGLDDTTKRKVDFFTRQYIDALAPSNFALTNPEVFRETIATGGGNLVKGLNNLLGDIERGNGRVRISMTDPKAFELGVNIATTPGKVVFRNDLIELIQFEPLTKKQFQRPLLVMPPWINKYYILDLREKNSFLRWCDQQGMTVFVISWVNPDAKLAAKNFEDYMLEGPLAALDAIADATGEKAVNAVGYCLGGTLLAATLGYMAARKDTRIASATFMTSLIDFSHAGELEVFIDEAQVASLEKKMNERGYLEGSEMANTFNLLRANDLIWSFVINNYLLGRDPFPFDLLHWNCDSTRMPAAMHSFYLRNFYMKNLLREPGGVKLGGVPIDLAKVRVPTYFVSAIEDHIAPWKTTFAGPSLVSGPSRFVLSGSGHIAGMVNPPAAEKYGFWTSDMDVRGADPDQWLAGAHAHPGSWWTDWRAWLDPHLGREVAARTPGKSGHKSLGNAPGTYARIRADG
ncbi:MAG: class I poly(R)-hydroxyalkanoic acid synthase [Proteobacteria bacterium]|nr:class I poly(R)-hydroxyalkanoic acid synthase [Pseudomonadota bacterium]